MFVIFAESVRPVTASSSNQLLHDIDKYTMYTSNLGLSITVLYSRDLHVFFPGNMYGRVVMAYSYMGKCG